MQIKAWLFCWNRHGPLYNVSSSASDTLRRELSRTLSEREPKNLQISK